MKKPLPYRLINKNRRLFLLLVNLSPILMIDLHMVGKRTIAEAAQRVGLKFSTYYRLRVFYRDHREMVREASRSGNWRPVEEILFPELLAAYPGFADSDDAYKAAMADWRERTKTSLQPPPFPAAASGKGGKAKVPTPRRRSVPKAPKPTSWLRRTLTRLGRWFS